MLSFQQALDSVLFNTKDFGNEVVSILDSTNRILAENIFADRGFPPYDRVTMDGIAINIVAYQNGQRTFLIEKMQPAGSPQQTLGSMEHCIEVMTGSVLPLNTNAVIPYEQCEIKEGMAFLKIGEVKPMQNVHIKDTDCRQGYLLIENHQKITPSTIGILASVGLEKVAVKRLPKVAVCSTGNELVNIHEQPKSHQVRRSNDYLLAAELSSYNILPSLNHLPDEAEQMTGQIKLLMQQNDVLLFSGAVSKGKLDFLPAVLKDLGMEIFFHMVAQRPGKPVLFGKFPDGQIVFGFPGNPVSTFVCYHKFFKPWLNACFSYVPAIYFAVLNEDFLFNPALTLHLPVTLSNTNGILHAQPVKTSSSGDMLQMAKANAIITLPAEKNSFAKGETFEATMLH